MNPYQSISIIFLIPLDFNTFWMSCWAPPAPIGISCEEIPRGHFDRAECLAACP